MQQQTCRQTIIELCTDDVLSCDTFYAFCKVKGCPLALVLYQKFSTHMEQSCFHLLVFLNTLSFKSFVKICLSVPSTHMYKGVSVLDETTFKFIAKFDAQENKTKWCHWKTTTSNLFAKNSQAHLNSLQNLMHRENKWCHWKKQCLTYLYAKNS